MGKKIHINGIKNKLYIIEILLLGSLILCLNLWNLNDYSGIMNGVDEYGYLSNAVFILGGDIDPIAHTLSYYSFGYSLFLSPLVKIITDTVLLFRAIIVLNSFFVALAFAFISGAAIKLHREIKAEIIVLFTFIAFFYVSNYVYSKYIYTECLLTLLISMFIYFFAWLIEDFKTYKMVFLGITAVYMYFVHQRAIVVLITLILFWGLFIIKKDISLKQCICVIFFLGIILGLGLLFKDILMDNIYTDSTRATLNDYSGQVSKLNYLLNIQGIKDFFLQFMAKIYYFSFSTILCGPIALFYSIKYIIRNRFDKCCYYYMFLLVLFLGIFLVQSIFLQGPVSRFDVVVYGRYAEYIYPILFLEGLIYIYSERQRGEVWRICLLAYGVTIVGITAAGIIFKSNNLQYYESYLCPALFSIYALSKDLNTGLMLSMLFTTTFFLFFMLGKQHKKTLVSSICILFIIFHFIGIYEINYNLRMSQSDYIEETAELISYIDSVNTNIFVLLDNTDNYQKYRRIQYRLYNSTFEGIYRNDLIDSDITGYILIDYTERDILQNITSKILIYDNNGFSLWYIGETL